MPLRRQLALFVALLAAASMLAYVELVLKGYQVAEAKALGTPRGNLSDLYPRWLGARELLLHGRDPYGSEITREIQTGYYGRPLDPNRPHDPKDQQAFAYPVYVVLVLAPTVKLPFPVVQQAFLWLLVALTACSIPLWLRALGWRISITAQLLWIVLTLGSFPAIQGFKLQQLTLLVAGLIAASMSLLASGYFFLAGVLLALASIKPQLVALPMATLLLWTLGNWRQRQKFVWGLALSLAALVGAGELLLPGWVSEFRRASADYWRYTGGGNSVLDVELTPLMGKVVAAVLVVLVLFWAWRLRRSEPRTLDFAWLLALTMATALAVIPMFAPYNQVLLLPAFMAVVRTVGTQWRAGALSRLILVLTGASVAWPWLVTSTLALAFLFLPAAEVEKAWLTPLFTNFWIPTCTLGLLLANHRAIRGTDAAD